MGLFKKKQQTVAAPPPPPPTPLPTEQDADAARVKAARKIAAMQGARSTILSGVLGDTKPPAVAKPLLSGQ